MGKDVDRLLRKLTRRLNASTPRPLKTIPDRVLRAHEQAKLKRPEVVSFKN